MKTWQRLLGAGIVLGAAAESQCTPGIHNSFTDGRDLSVVEKHDLGTVSSSADFALATFPDLAMIPLALTSVSPALGPSTGGTTLTLTGTHFAPGATVTIFGKPATVTQMTSTQLTVTLPAASLTKGPVAVVVHNPDGTEVTRADLFSYYYGSVQFGTATTVAVGKTPYSVAIGKMNGDMAPDLVVANFGDTVANVGVLFGGGDGSFGAMATYPTGNRPKSVALADFNNDMYLDVVSANFTGPSVSVLLNDKSGRLLAKTDYATSTAGPSAVAAKDVNNDGYADVVTANYTGKDVSYYLSKTGGGLPTAQSVAAGNGPAAIIMADVNADNKMDFVVANQNSGDCMVYLGDGKGAFTLRGTYFAGNGPAGLAVADVDNDGKVDLLVSLAQDNTVGVMKGNGDGFFNEAKPYGAGTSPSGIAVADFNGDGLPDIVTAAYYDNAVTILLNVNGVPGTKLSLATGGLPLGLAVGDLDGDSRPDIVVVNSGDNTVSVFMNKSQ